MLECDKRSSNAGHHIDWVSSCESYDILTTALELLIILSFRLAPVENTDDDAQDADDTSESSYGEVSKEP